MLFLTFSNENVQFVEKKLTWKSYITAEALLTTKRVEFINKKEFAKATLNENSEIFIIYVASLNLAPVPGIYLDREIQIAVLLTEEVKILDKYADYANVFSEKKALILLEHTQFNENTINQEDGKQQPYGPIYSLGPIKTRNFKDLYRDPSNNRIY